MNRSPNTNIGEPMLSCGGGHQNDGICQIANDRAECVLRELLTGIDADG